MSFDELMKNMRRDYIRDLSKRIQQIEDLCRAADLESLRNEFHKLKGTGKTYGVPEISEVCAPLEQLCRAQSPHALSATPLALTLLRDIQTARTSDQIFDALRDSRFAEIQKHLQAVGGPT